MTNRRSVGMIQPAVCFLCMFILHISAESVETRIHELVIPSASSKVEFGRSMQGNDDRNFLLVGAPKLTNGGIYSCSYSYNTLTNRSIQCSSQIEYGDQSSTVGSTMAKLTVGGENYLVVCGDQYKFSCPDLRIQQRMIGECYSHKLSSDEKIQLRTPCPISCPQGLVADLVFAMDASGSVGQDNFNAGLQWVITVLKTFSYDLNQANLQAGYVIFNERPYTVEVPQARNFYDLEDRIENIFYAEGGTRTDLAIERAGDILTSARNGVPKVMITVTDGLSNRPERTTTAAANARANGIVMIAVGVGTLTEQREQELRRIATGNENSGTRVMTVSSYQNLNQILDQISAVIKETASTGLEGAESNSTTELTNCQFGTSVAASSKGLYVGASGSYDRTGTVAEFSPLTGFPKTTSSGHLNVTELAEILGTTEKQVKDAYFGYSVTAGSFMNNAKVWVVTSAPRYLSRGLVLIYEEGATNVRTVLRPSDVSGYWQLGGYYGHTVLAMDVNKDNYDDLLVSAPLFSKTAGYDEGLVFVYINDRSTTSVADWANPGFTPLILGGSSVTGSRFGMTIVDGGDIDKNGYNDVIISAPGERDSNEAAGSGAIYIYFASNRGLVPTEKQRILGSSVSTALKALSGFGSAVYGGSDFDGNGYPDIAVSAPSSDAVVLLRSRRLIVPSLRVSVTPTTVDVVGCARSPASPCSTIRACISAQYKENPTGETFGMVQNVTLDSMIGDSIHRRFYFIASRTSVVSEADINVGRSETCRRYTMQLDVEKLGKVNGGGFEVTPRVKFTADLSPVHKDTVMSGILSSTSENSKTADWTFSKGCSGNGGRCEHDLVLTATYSEAITSDPIVLTGTSRKLSVKCVIENRGGDHAYFLKVNISSGNLTVNRVNGSCVEISDDESDLNLGVTVIKYKTSSSVLKDLMASGERCEFTVEFDFTKLQSLASEPQLRIMGKVYSKAGGETIAFDPNKGNNEFTYLRTMQYKSTILLSGASDPQSVFFHPPDDQNVTKVRTLEDAVLGGSGSKFFHKYTIYNNGPLGFSNAKVKISWPEMTKGGYNLFYLVDVQCEPGGSCACQKEGKTNKLRIAPDEASIRPYFREVTLRYPDQSNAFVTSEKQTCENNACSEILCDIGHIGKFQQIIVSAVFKPWVPTFGQAFTKAEIYSSFKLLPAVSTLLPVETDETVGSIMTSYDPSNPPPAPPTNAPNIGAIIGGIIGGLVLLAIAILIMWKAGFFKSKYGNMTREARKSVREAREVEAVEGGPGNDPQLNASTEYLYDN